MKSLIVYKSVHHNNTKKIAQVLAKELGADLAELKKAKNYNLQNYDLIGFGSGIYLWRHHALLLKFIRDLPKTKKKAFIFSTSGISLKGIFNGHKALKEKLKDRGFEIVGEFNCLGWDTFSLLKLFGGLNKGRPNGKDCLAAQGFARKLK